MWVLGFVLAVDSTDQSILRGVQPLIKSSFHLSDAAVGFLASAFVLVNALTTIPAGYLADRVNRTRVIGITIVLWSGFTALTGACMNFVELLAVRGLLGFGLGVTEPSANSLLTDHYPIQQRGKAFSIQQQMVFVGFGLGIALGGGIGALLGWRWAFVLVGGPGVITALLVTRLHEPKRGYGDRLSIGLEPEEDKDEERPPLFEHGVGTFIGDLVRGLWADLKTIIAIPTLRYVLVGVGVLLFSVTGVGYWLPVYLQRFAHMSVASSTGAVGGIVIAAGLGGTWFGGRLADRYQNKIAGARIALPSYCVMSGTVLFTISLAPMPTAAVLLIQTVAVFCLVAAVPGIRAGTGDALPATLRGAGFAAFSLVSTLSGAALAPPLLGYLSDLTNLRTAFVICMPPIFLGAVIMFRARKHLDEDVGKVLMAVQRAYQEQQALEEKRAAEEAT